MRRSCAIRGNVSPSIDTQAEFFPVETTNARCTVGYLTISVAGSPAQSRRDEIEEIVRARGGRVTWRINPSLRSYGLLEFPGAFAAAELRGVPGETVYDGAVIGWAVFPTVREALPYLYEALGGAGRPVGVLACRHCEGGAVVEWDPGVTGTELILRLVDLELRRFNSPRRAALLSPAMPGMLAKVAASGLQAAEIGEERILELLINDVRT
jgi:hypothetical protein